MFVDLNKNYLSLAGLHLTRERLVDAAPDGFMDFSLQGFAIESAISSSQRAIEAIYSGSRQAMRTQSQHENWFRSHFLLQREAMLRATSRQQLGTVHCILQVGCSLSMAHQQSIQLRFHLPSASSSLHPSNRVFRMNQAAAGTKINR